MSNTIMRTQALRTYIPMAENDLYRASIFVNYLVDKFFFEYYFVNCLVDNDFSKRVMNHRETRNEQT